MTLERALEYASSNYTRRYRVTLRPTRANIERAYHAYLVGACNCLPRRRAVVEALGYRYRRLENLIEEVGFYETHRPRGWWLYEERIVKVNCSYTSRRRSRVIDMDVELSYVWPLDGTPSASYPQFFVNLALDTLDSLGFPEALVAMVDCQPEPKEQVIGHIYLPCWRDYTVVVIVVEYIYKQVPQGAAWASPAYSYSYHMSYPGDVLEPLYSRLCPGGGRRGQARP